MLSFSPLATALYPDPPVTHDGNTRCDCNQCHPNATWRLLPKKPRVSNAQNHRKPITGGWESNPHGRFRPEDLKSSASAAGVAWD